MTFRRGAQGRRPIAMMGHRLVRPSAGGIVVPPPPWAGLDLDANTSFHTLPIGDGAEWRPTVYPVDNDGTDPAQWDGNWYLPTGTGILVWHTTPGSRQILAVSPSYWDPRGPVFGGVAPSLGMRAWLLHRPVQAIYPGMELFSTRFTNAPSIRAPIDNPIGSVIGNLGVSPVGQSSGVTSGNVAVPGAPFPPGAGAPLWRLLELYESASFGDPLELRAWWASGTDPYRAPDGIATTPQTLAPVGNPRPALGGAGAYHVYGYFAAVVGADAADGALAAIWRAYLLDRFKAHVGLTNGGV